MYKHILFVVGREPWARASVTEGIELAKAHDAGLAVASTRPGGEGQQLQARR